MKIYTCIGCGCRLERRRKGARCKACQLDHLRAENDALVYAGLVEYKRRHGGTSPKAAELADLVGFHHSWICKSLHRLAAAGRVEIIADGSADRWRALAIPGEVWSMEGIL